MNRWLLQLRIGRRLALGFGLILALLASLAGASAWQAARLQGNTEYFATDLVPSLGTLKQFTQAVDESRRMDWQVAFLDEERDRAESEKRLLEARQSARTALKSYEALVSDETDRRHLGTVTRALDAYVAVQDRLITAARTRVSDPTQNERAKSLATDEGRKVYRVLKDATTAWWEFNTTMAEHHASDSQAAYRQVLTLMAAFTAAGLLIGATAAWLLTRSITTPLRHAVAMTRRVASGDLTHQPRPSSRDELGELLDSLGEMTEQLGRTVADIRQGTDAIATASAQIAQGNTDLSSRTEQQASGLQQTAASIEQLSGTARTSADNARQANQLAGRASEVARAGGVAVQDVVSTMGEIQTASRRIADIIGVIDGIAFQTNILALNAAVEAARAGEQGRGFAVVASEVRSLAQRSADAAREIKGLIGTSVERVEAGGTLVTRAGQTIGDVVEQVRKVSDLIGEISAGSIEQDAGVGQINQAIVSLDQATQQNAALVEETAAAAESLRQQAGRLAQSVAAFRIDPRPSSALQLPAAAPRPVPPVAPAPVAARSAPTATRQPPAAAPVAHDDWESF